MGHATECQEMSVYAGASTVQKATTVEMKCSSTIGDFKLGQDLSTSPQLQVSPSGVNDTELPKQLSSLKLILTKPSAQRSVRGS